MTDYSVETPEALCWHCSQLLSGASPIENKPCKPEKGAVSLCLYCGAVGVFDEDLILRQPTKEFLDDLAEDEGFRQNYISFAWARQYLMLKVRLLGET